MATITLLRDDITGRFIKTPKNATHKVIISGKTYEVDLTEDSKIRLLDPIQKHGRKSGEPVQATDDTFARDDVNGQFISVSDTDIPVTVNGQKYEISLGRESFSKLLAPIQKHGRLLSAA